MIYFIYQRKVLHYTLYETSYHITYKLYIYISNLILTLIIIILFAHHIYYVIHTSIHFHISITYKMHMLIEFYEINLNISIPIYYNASSQRIKFIDTLTRFRYNDIEFTRFVIRIL